MSLAGSWNLRLDPTDSGLGKHYWFGAYPDQINLPGSLTEQGKGNPVTLDTPWTGDIFDSTYFVSPKYQKYRQGDIKIPFWLKPVNYYVGPAWYRRQVTIPADWSKKRIVLNLERCHWETMVYVNGEFCGTRNSLVTPHQFDVSGYLKPGVNTIAIRVDNRIKLHIGPNSHSIADHTQTNWNGIVGDIALEATDPVFFDDIQVYPNLKNQTIRLAVTVRQPRHQQFTGKFSVQVKNPSKKGGVLPLKVQQVSFSTEIASLTATYSIPDPVLWDEFTPNLYQVVAQLTDQQGQLVRETEIHFGMREISTQGTRITVNSRPVFLRGDVDCAAFPLTGYPPTSEAPWEKIMTTLKQYGLNHLRFHSWCPPDAAFRVADKLGLYLYVESPLWANQGSAVGTDGLIDTFIYQESERIIRQYGNHPSFCMMSYGNEPGGRHQHDFLGRWVDHFKQADPRRLYTSGAGWPMLPENQFHIHSNARIQHWEEGLASIINQRAPQTSYDWRDTIKTSTVPYISHEIGQWCVYPDFKEMGKYTGVVKPTNFEIFKETLEANGMGDQAEAFLQSSGRLQTLCYKADIEAALRTPGFGGFQLLGLHDFPGQGTALVGAMNTFYEPKSYTNAREYRTFCNPTVLLARMDKLVYQNNQTLTAALEIAHFGASELRDQTILWRLTDAKGAIKRSGQFTKDKIRIDNAQFIGTIEVPLSMIKTSQQLKLSVVLKGSEFTNSWDIWVYPAGTDPAAVTGKVLITQALTNDIVQKLQEGASVLLLPYGHVKEGKGAEVKIGFSSVFWNTSWTKGQAPHTLGLICDPAQPLFASFPTESHSNFQWHDIVSHSQAVILDGFPTKLRPLIQPIDTWFENRRLSLAFEGKVGKGKLMVCTIDLENDLAKRPVARQLKYSLLQYMNSSKFTPVQQLDLDNVRSLFSEENVKAYAPAEK
ncbi:glycoside hydrolase family 2 TIM barrel-domain containing protein [Spirosoma aerophilum]